MAIARADTTTATEGVEPTRYLFTVHEYHKMAEIGIFDEDSRVELIEGEILIMPPIGESHFGHVNRFNRVFMKAFSTVAVVHIQNPVRLGLRNEPEPDVVLLRYREDDYLGKFPGPEDVLLLVEVADSSLGHDRNTKVPLYAQAGIPEYWIVDLVHHELIVHRGPSRGEYRSMQRLSRDATVTPVAFPDVPLAVADLLG